MTSFECHPPSTCFACVHGRSQVSFPICENSPRIGCTFALSLEFAAAFQRARKCYMHISAMHFLICQARKRHININFLVRLLLGRPRECGLSLGHSGVFARDKARFSPYFTQWKPSLCQGQTQFVPGTIPGTKAGRKSLCVKSLCAFFVWIFVRVVAREAPKTPKMAFRLCTFVGAHEAAFLKKPV